ncbi:MULTISPECIES: ferredoxin [unclassified Streptomyces]|uniref:ferredoxin n=1 Tax=unclassified Streptomyces TaxID=2593676 RepID=UPI0015F930BD|nr:ferredoxin [Streptomyces sp. GMR22]MBA6433583.1 ferredoxin [Streptomyces sp. GMR22]MBI0383835.1 ferredoxin [Streptomyces albiflaviniger]
MRIVVDLNRCQGYAQCAFLAPDVFAMHGEEALLYDARPDDARRADVLRAVAACPVRAITVEGAGGRWTADRAGASDGA